MKLYVSVGIYNSIGSCATVDTKDDASLRLREGYNLTARAACKKAAQDLREDAARFDLLAESENPYHRKTHDQINRSKVVV